MSREVKDERWENLLLSYGIDPKFKQEIKVRADHALGIATQQLDGIKKFADENGMDINLVMTQVLIRDVFTDLAIAAEKWGNSLRAIMKHLPCQQAQYSLQDVEAIKMHCDSFIKYGPKPADEEVPLDATVYKEEEHPQLSPEEYEALTAEEQKLYMEMMNSKPVTAPAPAESINLTDEQIREADEVLSKNAQPESN